MKHIIRYSVFYLMAATLLSACHERYVTYDDAEYVMFADTLKVYPILEEAEEFSIPVVSTVVRDYDRTFGVEVIDKTSNAIERKHYTILSNTVVIKAGETRADIRVRADFDSFEPTDSLGFTLQLVMNDNLEMPLYGKQTKAVLMKSGPFDMEMFTGYCVLSSMFLQQYNQVGGFNRLVYTEPHPTLKNAPKEKSTVDVEDLERRCKEAMADDLNSPMVISALFDWVRIINQAAEGQQSFTAEDLERLKEIVNRYVFDILGLRNEKAAEAGGKDMVSPLVEMLLQMRMTAKANKDWATSDKIRDELTAIGIRVKDRKDGYDWELE